MSLYTLFTRMAATVTRKDSDTPAFSQEVDIFAESQIHNVLYAQQEQMDLDDGDTRTINISNLIAAQGNWVFVIARVIGEASLNLVGDDLDDATETTAAQVGYGTDLHPGMIMLSTYNLETAEIEGLADGTKVVLWFGVLAEDDDARLTTNT